MNWRISSFVSSENGSPLVSEAQESSPAESKYAFGGNSPEKGNVDFGLQYFVKICFKQFSNDSEIAPSSSRSDAMILLGDKKISAKNAWVRRFLGVSLNLLRIIIMSRTEPVSIESLLKKQKEEKEAAAKVYIVKALRDRSNHLAAKIPVQRGASSTGHCETNTRNQGAETQG